MKLFKSNYTKWQPAHLYTHNWNTYLIQVRRNKKTGLLQFKTIKVNAEMTQMDNIKNPYDFEKIIKDFPL